LRNPNFFNVPEDKLGSVSGLLIFVSLPLAIIGTLFIGYVYDILGRRLTLFSSLFIGSVLTGFVPWTSPKVIPWLLMIRMAIQLCFCAPNASPLPGDYIHKDSIGKGIAMVGLGVLIGDVISMGVLFRVTAHMQPEISFAICGGVGVFFSLFLICMIKEPQLREPTKIEFQNALLQPTTPMQVKKIEFDEPEVKVYQPIPTPKSSKNLPEDVFKQLSVRQKMKILTRQLCEACSEQKVIPVCFLGSAISKLYNILFSTFWLLFI
jgi:MFS family permease